MEEKDIIVKNDFPWIVILHPEHSELSRYVSGKWVHHGTPDMLGKIALDLSILIREDLTPEIKYRSIPNDPTGPFANLLPPLCVYASSKNKAALHARMLEYGLSDTYWQSNEATKVLHRKILGR